MRITKSFTAAVPACALKQPRLDVAMWNLDACAAQRNWLNNALTSLWKMAKMFKKARQEHQLEPLILKGTIQYLLNEEKNSSPNQT